VTVSGALDPSLALLRESSPLLSPPLKRALVAFSKWLFLPDPDVVLVTYGALAANHLPGDPTWLLLVGAPGSGKTEALLPAMAVPSVRAVSTLTRASLLSGTAKKEHADSAKGGLLRELGDFGCIVIKDFTSILSLHREERAEVLAALREVYDGSYSRAVGTDGGKTVSWQGKIGLLAAVTPTVDRHHALMASMGERFVMFRLPEVDADSQALRALDHAGKEKQMRAELAEAVTRLFEPGLPAEPKPLDGNDKLRLMYLATFVVKARSAVERDGYTRDIELVPGSEAPTRIIVALSRLLAGLDALGASREDGWRIITRAGLDSIPALPHHRHQDGRRAGRRVDQIRA